MSSFKFQASAEQQTALHAIAPRIKTTYGCIRGPLATSGSQVPPSKPQSQSQCQSKNFTEELQPGVEVSIDGCNFRILGLLGRGHQGSVWSAINLNGGSTVAIKETRCTSEFGLLAAEREPRIMRSIVGVAKRSLTGIVSPDIIACETGNSSSGGKTVRVAMTKVPGDSLASFLQQFTSNPLPSNEPAVVDCISEAQRFTLSLLSQLSAAFQSISVVALHRDISAVNVLVSMSKGASHPEFGLIDFGLATEIETWEKQMAHVCTVGNGFYWPVSSWYIFMYGGPKLLEHEGLRMEYLTQLDLHALGVLSLEVFLTLVRRVTETRLPEEIRSLIHTWDQCRAETRSLVELMHRAADGRADWDIVRQMFIESQVDRIIESGFAWLHRELQKARNACMQAGLDSPLGNVASLFELFAHLISPGKREGGSVNSSWSSVRNIIGKCALVPRSLTDPPKANACAENVKVPQTPRSHKILVENHTLVVPLPRASVSSNGPSSVAKAKVKSLPVNSAKVEIVEVREAVKISEIDKAPVSTLQKISAVPQVHRVEKTDFALEVATKRTSVPLVQTVKKDIDAPINSVIGKVVIAPLPGATKDVVTKEQRRKIQELTRRVPVPQIHTSEKVKTVPEVQRVEKTTLVS